MIGSLKLPFGDLMEIKQERRSHSNWDVPLKKEEDSRKD